MASKDKDSKSKSKNQSQSKSPSFVNDNQCPNKEGDNCKEPGVFSDSPPIGGGG